LSQQAASEGGLIQLHLVHPYSIEICKNSKVKRYLELGYLIKHLQRVTDREVLVTLGQTAES
jgi:hypothetical protein